MFSIFAASAAYHSDSFFPPYWFQVILPQITHMTVSWTLCFPHSTPRNIIFVKLRVDTAVYLPQFPYFCPWSLSAIYPLAPVAMATTVWHWHQGFLLTAPPVSDCQWKRTTRPTVGTVKSRSVDVLGDGDAERHLEQIFHSSTWICSSCFGWTALRSPAEISGHARRYTRLLPLITCLWCSWQFLFSSVDIPLLYDIFRPQTGYMGLQIQRLPLLIQGGLLFPLACRRGLKVPNIASHFVLRRDVSQLTCPPRLRPPLHYWPHPHRESWRYFAVPAWH